MAPIMNDKQLWELKNILSHNTEHGTRSTEHKPMGIPPLTHIMNLPKAGTAVFPKEAVSPGVRDASGGKKAQEEPKKAFWQKIKDVLSEKELPAGHKEASGELLLSDHSAPALAVEETLAENKKGEKNISQAVPRNTFAKSLSRPVAPRPLLKKEPLPAKSPEQIPAYLNKLEQVLQPRPSHSFEIPKKFPEPVEPKVEEVTIGTLRVSNLIISKGKEASYSSAVDFKTPPVRKEIIQTESKKEDKREDVSDADFFVPGLKDAGILMDAKLRGSEPSPFGTGGGDMVASPGIEAGHGGYAKHPDKHFEPINITTLDQVGKLQTKDLLKDITPPLKSLSGILGYHRLALTLEKSPLFQSYINTGLAVLGGKYDLKSGEYREKTMERYLTKDEFERVVDVLRAIKS